MSAPDFIITFRWLWTQPWRGRVVIAYRFEHEPENVLRLAWAHW
jgi:hypothetical protein